MNFLNKIEDIINQLIMKLMEFVIRLMPAPVKSLGMKLQRGWESFLLWLKKSPFLLKSLVLKLVAFLKSIALGIDFKAIFVDTYQKAVSQSKKAGSGKFKTVLMAPFLVVGQWVQGLSPVQTLMLLIFSGLSVISVVGIGFSGKRLVENHLGQDRSPASAEEVIEYERPDYYKKQHRHFEIVSFRLPVYVPQVNEIRSVDIDFIATLSNRNARMFLEKNEFHFRDHLINNVEPSVSSFPLEEEGKEIIRKKIWTEVDEFLKLKGVEGHVTELKITYVLAN